MFIIRKELNGNGSCQPPIQYPSTEVPCGYAIIEDSVNMADFYKYNGFIDPVFTDIDGQEVMVSYTPNVVAWESWKSSIPEPEPKRAPLPTTRERVDALEEQIAQADETAIALYESQLEQEEINKSQDETIAAQNDIIAAQDEALIMLYEMIGG